eukprot:272644_1
MSTRETKQAQTVEISIRNERLQNSLVVCGYIRNIESTLNNTITIPLELIELCKLFCFCCISKFTKEKLLVDIYSNVRAALQNYNFLLCEKLSLYYISNRNDNKNMFHNILGMTYEQMKLSQKSEYHYKKAIEIRPKNEIYYWNYTALLIMQQRYKEAINCLNKAINTNKNELCYKFEKAQCLEKLNKYNEAQNEYLKLINISTYNEGKKNGKNYLYKAIGFMKLDNMNKCNEMHKKYLKCVDKTKIVTNTSYGRLLWVLSKYDEALQFFDKAIQLKRQNAFTWYYKGMILIHKNKYIQAKYAFQNSLGLCAVFVDCENALWWVGLMIVQICHR